MGCAVLAAAFAACLLGGAPVTPAEAKPAPMVERAAPIATGRLFDLGVSDYDRDGDPELYSVNHKFLGTLAEYTSSGWADRLGSSGFSPSPDYPGFEDLLRRPDTSAPGLYIFAESRTEDEADNPEATPLVHLLANRVSGIPLLPETARGSVSLPSPSVEVVREDGAEVTVSREGNRSVIRFEVAESGHIVLKVRKVDLPPIDVAIDQAPLLARTFVGADAVPAAASSFRLQLIDRHAVAWADLDDDRLTDAFVVRGGLGGGIAQFIGEISDELLRQDPSGRFAESIAGSGLTKGGCRSRQTAAVDFDGDGLLDLFSSCKGGPPQLYRRLPDGGFEDVSGPLARHDRGGSYYRWVDLRGDRRPELVVTAKRSVRVLRPRGSRGFGVAQRLDALNGARLVYSVAPGDFDADGDPDLFVGAKSGNTLLVNRDGRLAARRPAGLGLPRRGTGASWVDYDNDGRLDLHSLPSGLHIQRKNGSFARSGLARGKASELWGIVNWFDLEGDGDRDLATAVRTSGDTPSVRARLRENTSAGNHWLQVDLRGADGNAEAIGAEVRVTTGPRTQTARVGESDGARYSQGHYRLYLGLGGAPRVDKIAVLWPDGGVTRLTNVAADRVLEVSHPG